MALLGRLAASAFCLLGAVSWPYGPARADDLSDFVAEKSAVVAMLQAKAQRAAATIAQDRLVLTYAVTTRIEVMEALKTKIEGLLLSVAAGLQAEEVGIVARDGRPLVRVVRGQVANEFEADEDDSAALEAARDLELGAVFVSPVYRSPDTGEWALSYAAPVRDDGEPYAVLHVQQSLRRKLNVLAARTAPPGIRWYVVEDGTRVIFDSASGAAPLSNAAADQSPDQFFGAFAIGGRSLADLRAENWPSGVGQISVDGLTREVGLKTVGRWTIVAIKEHHS